MGKMTQFQVSVAAEAYAAALLARSHCDVSVQYGANQPEYDLIVAHGDRFLKVSVKGSQDGGWGLFQSYKKGRTYHEAIDYWAQLHKGKKIVYCLVQFLNTSVSEMPRIYIATVSEIAKQSKAQRGGNGYTSLREVYNWASGVAKGSNDQIPTEWKFSQERVDDLLSRFG